MIVSDQNRIQGEHRQNHLKQTNQTAKEMACLDEQIGRYQQKFDIQNKRIKFLKKQIQTLSQKKEKMKVSSLQIRQQNQLLKERNKQLKTKFNDVKELFNDSYNAKNISMLGAVSQTSSFLQKKVTSVRIKTQNITQSTQEVDLTNTEIKDQDIQSLKFFPKVKTLLLGDNQITSNVIADIFQNCRNLRKLFLHNTLIDDEGLQKIGFLGQLRCLDVRSNQLSDTALRYIKNCKKITQLSISNNIITDHGLSYLKDLSQLNYLDVTSNKIGESQAFEENLKFLVNLPLTHLYLSHNFIDTRFIEVLINMKGLKVLDLRFNRVQAKRKSSFRDSKPQGLQLFI